MDIKKFWVIVFGLALAAAGSSPPLQAQVSNRVRYEGPRRATRSTTNRVYYSGPKQTQPISTMRPRPSLPEARVMPPKVEPSTTPSFATPSERAAILTAVAPYTREDPIIKVDKAFWDLMPTLSEFEELFADRAQAEKAFHEYFAMYEKAFHRPILRKMYGIKLNRTVVYETRLLDYAPTHWRNSTHLVDRKVLKADFFWPADKFGVLTEGPVFSLLFVKLNNDYKIFHLEALKSLSTKPY